MAKTQNVVKNSRFGQNKNSVYSPNLPCQYVQRNYVIFEKVKHSTIPDACLFIAGCLFNGCPSYSVHHTQHNCLHSLHSNPVEAKTPSPGRTLLLYLYLKGGSNISLIAIKINVQVSGDEKRKREMEQKRRRSINMLIIVATTYFVR